MTKKDEIKKLLPGADGNPFTVPEGYFENFESRLASRITSEDPEKKNIIKLNLRPYLSLAASITGIALITFTVLQFVVGNKYNSEEYYDIALLEEAGLVNDEAILSESYNSESLDEDASWEEEATEYLASSDVGLEYLLALN